MSIIKSLLTHFVSMLLFFFNASQSSAANSAEYWGALAQPTVNIRVVFRTQSNICNEAFFAFARQLFLQKSYIVGIWLGSKCTFEY